nr:hypothetical protein [Tanacetum cinerariifolium]
VEVKFVGVEDVIHQNSGFAQRNADVHPHRYLRYDALHLVHQVDELGQGEGTQIRGPGGRLQLQVARVLGLAAQQHRRVASCLQLLNELNPLFGAPKAGGPAVAAAGIQADARAGAGGRQGTPVVALVVVSVEYVFLAPEIEAAQLENLLHVGLGIADAELVKHASEVLVLSLLVDGPRHAIVGPQGVAVFGFGLHVQQQGTGFLFLVKVDGNVEMPGLQLQSAGVVKLQNLLYFLLWQNSRREREPRDVAPRILLPQPPQQRRRQVAAVKAAIGANGDIVKKLGHGIEAKF